ncbi:MAG: RHS repeat-associated core domain-containing protein [Leptospirales bacterium]
MSKKTKRYGKYFIKVFMLLTALLQLQGFPVNATIPQGLPAVTINANGKAVTSLPIRIPPATKDLLPELSLTYNSGGKNGIAGVGWSLRGIHFISRNEQLGVHYNWRDDYTSSLAGRMRKISGSFGNYYHSERESFIRFEPVQPSTFGPVSWNAHMRSGIKYKFGTSVNSKVAGNGTHAAYTNAWGLSSVRDLNNNGYDITYTSQSQIDGVLYPASISYNGGKVVITFTYESRGDTTPGFASANTKGYTKRLHQISVAVNGTDVEQYTFVYEQTGFTNRSRLVKIERDNYDPLVLNYSDHPITRVSDFNSGVFNNLNYHYPLADQTPCHWGRISCLCSAYAPCVATFGPHVYEMCAYFVGMYTKPCLDGVEGSKTYFMDVDGDTKPDFVRITGIQNNNKLSVNYVNDRGIKPTITGTQTINMTENSYMIPADFNGDMRMDLLILEENGRDLKVAYASSNSANPLNVVTMTGMSINLPKASEKIIKNFAADITGDGRADYIEFNPGDIVKVYTSYGSTFSSARTININDLGDSYQNFIDMDKDGVADFVRISGSKILVSFINSYNFTVLKNTTSDVTIGTDGNRFLNDVNGDGYLDFIVFNGAELIIHLFDGNEFSTKITRPVNFTHLTTEGMGGTSSANFSLHDVDRDGFDDRVTFAGDSLNIQLYNSATGAYASSFSVSESGNSSVDLNGDGNKDTIIFETPNLTVNLYDSEGDEYKTYGIRINITEASPTTSDNDDMQRVTNEAYGNWRNSKSFADVDGDGRADFVRFYNGKTYISYSRTLNESVYFNPGGDYDFASQGFHSLADYNSDGRADFIGISSGKEQIFYNTNEGFATFRRQNNTSHSTNGRLHLYLTPVTGPNDILTEISDSKGRSTNVRYDIPMHIGGIVNLPLTTTQPLKPNIFPDHVVTNITTDYGANITRSFTYSYGESKVFLGDSRYRRTALGFSYIKSLNNNTGQYLLDKYIQDSWDYAGLVYASYGYDGSVLQNRSVINYEKLNSHFGMLIVRPKKSTNEVYQAGVKIKTINNSPVYDRYNNIIESNTSLNNTFSQVFSRSYYTNETSWILSRLEASVKKSNGAILEHKKYFYSNDQLSELHDYTGSGNWAKSYFLEYDTYGNVTLVEDPLGRQTTFTYDTYAGIFIEQTTNPLGFITKKTHDYNFGVVLTSEYPNGGIEAKNYDEYGRLKEIISPGETQWTRQFVYHNTGDPGLEYTETILRDDENADDFWVREYTDSLGRGVRKESKAFGGNILTEIFEYDERNRLISKTDPYLDGLHDPIYSSYEYGHPDGILTKIINPDESTNSYTYSVFDSTGITKAKDGTLLNSEIVKNDARGLPYYRKVQSGIMRMQYDSAGRVVKITDPASDVTTFTYDLKGNRISIKDKNGGRVTSVYDIVGRMIQQTDGANRSVYYTYDDLNRTKTLSAPGEPSVTYTYDVTPFQKGRVSSVTDGSGTTSFDYDIRGNNISTTRQTDDITLIFNREYDVLNRLQAITYPDGAKVYYQYSDGGGISALTMDTADGSSTGHTVVDYTMEQDGSYKVFRTTGNGVKTEITYDPVTKRPEAMQTVLADGTVEHNRNYIYNAHGNITDIEDVINPARTQSFVYDDLDRLTNASGNYGTRTYAYSENGNMTTKGDITLSYNNPLHVHGVTKAQSSVFGTKTYAYDGSGKMTDRNGDAITYDGYGRVSAILTAGGDNINYSYDYRGTRIKIYRAKTNTTVYSMDNLYEVEKKGGNPHSYTMYIIGLHNEIVAQYTRTDTVLLAAQDNTDTQVGMIAALSGGFLCKGVAIKCTDFWRNRAAYYSRSFFNKILFVKDGQVGPEFYGILVLLLLTGLLFYSVVQYRNTSGISLFKAITVPIYLTAFSLSFGLAGCGPAKENPQGKAPWFITPDGVDFSTPSVDNPGNGGNPPGGGGPPSGAGPVNAGSPTTGMYFYHTDHVGSVVMITNSMGHPVSGGQMDGKSELTYTPYGEINRADSGGPDIFRYKYTSQEEERETGLYFYDSRFYDPELGRFLQPDSVGAPKQPQGMNRYMYTLGNPVKYRDSDGRLTEEQITTRIVKSVTQAVLEDIASQSFEGAAMVVLFGAYSKQQQKKKLERMKTHQIVNVVGAVVVGAVLTVASGGTATPGWVAVGKYVASMAAGGAFGYAIGSTVGYVVGKNFGTSGSSEADAVAGASLGGSIGFGIGMAIGGSWFKEDLAVWAESSQDLARFKGLMFGKGGNVIIRGGMVGVVEKSIAGVMLIGNYNSSSFYTDAMIFAYNLFTPMYAIPVDLGTINGLNDAYTETLRKGLHDWYGTKHEF